MSYIGNTPGVSSQRVVLEEVITGSPKSAFVPISGYIRGYVDVLINGVEIDTADFTAPDGVTVTLGTAAAVGDTVKIKTWLPRGLSDGYLKSEADARFHPLISGNLLLTPNAGSNRVIGFASGTDTTLVLQGGGTSGGGANLELTRDYRAFLDATTTEIRSLDGSTVFASLNSSGLSLPNGGIKFSAAQVASSDANTLDDYEEGTFTPAFKATGSTFNYSYQAGAYTKVGRLVTCMIAIGLNGTGNSFNGSTLTITGLPFTQLAGSLYWNVTPVNFASLATSVVSLQGRLSLGAEIELSKLTAATTNPTTMVASDLNPTSAACVIYVLATYSVA